LTTDTLNKLPRSKLTGY